MSCVTFSGRPPLSGRLEEAMNDTPYIDGEPYGWTSRPAPPIEGTDTDSTPVHRRGVRYPLKRRHRDHRPSGSRWMRGWLGFSQRRDASSVDIAPFKFHSHELYWIVERGDLLTLKNEGTDGLLRGLLTDIKRGISTREASDDDPLKSSSIIEGRPLSAIVPLTERRRIYGTNRAWDSSSTIIALLLCKPWKLVAPAVYANLVLIVLGLLDDYALRSADDRVLNWVVSLVVLAIIVAMAFFQLLIQWRLALQIQALHEEIEGPRVEVVRDGNKQKVYAKDIVVGDIVFLEAGGVVPCDGILLSGHGVACGWSRRGRMKKVTIEHLTRMMNHSDPRIDQTDCFLRAGTKVLEGSGRYVVTAVSKIGEGTPLPFDMYDRHVWSKKGFISERSLRKGSVIIAPLLFPLFMIKFFIRVDDQRTSIQKGSEFVNILILWTFLIMIVYLPQCLPSPISTQHSLMKHLIKDRILVQMGYSCELMAAVTDLCTDMTGTITEDRMTVISGLVGTHLDFRRDHQATVDSSSRVRPQVSERSVGLRELNLCLSPSLQRLLNETIVLTSTALQDVDPSTGDTEFLGSATEVALLQFAQELEWPEFQSTRSAAQILEMIPFSSNRMASGAFVDLGEGRRRLYLKGASEVLAEKCTRRILADEDVDDEIQTSPMDSTAENIINQTITSYTDQGLRTISLCYRDFDSWPPDGLWYNQHDDDVEYEDFARDLTFVGIVCIYNPIRYGVREAVRELRGAGITVRMCTGDHPATAETIARQCDIPVLHHRVVKGADLSARSFREDIQVLARSSPENKAYFVRALQRRKRVVAFLGDGTNDRLALKAADVSFSMAVAGTEVSNVSDVVVLDQSFDSISKVRKWGEWLKDSRGQFIDLYIPTSLTIVFLTFISSLASSTSEPALSLVQILCITLLINPLAVLALSTDKPWLDKAPPVAPSLPSIYYLVAETLIVLLLFIFGHKFPDHSSTENMANVSDRTRTLIFNTMAFMQISRTLIHWKPNRRGLLATNWMFPIILICGVAIHLSIVLKGGSTCHVMPMNGVEWGFSMALSVLAVPLAFMLNRVRKFAEQVALRLG